MKARKQNFQNKQMLWNWMNINLCPVGNKWTACSTKESQLTVEYNKVHTKNDVIQYIHTYNLYLYTILIQSYKFVGSCAKITNKIKW